MSEYSGPRRVKRATIDAVPLLVDLMEEFHGEAGYPLERRSAATAFSTLLADPALGAVWIGYDGDDPAAHAVLTYRFGMEFFGLEGWVDDLFVRPAHRRRGHAARLLAAARAECERGGVHAMHVIVERGNAAALSLYRAFGFVEHTNDRTTLSATLPAAAPPAECGA